MFYRIRFVLWTYFVSSLHSLNSKTVLIDNNMQAFDP
jgi:hypothetical protein